jgi:alpha-soluble NSF attachment protein
MGGSNGDQILAKAEKKSSSSVGWFGSSSSKWEEAGDLFQQVSIA